MTAAAPLDTAAIREQFPILAREVHGRPLVYLDNAATTQKPQSVIDALSHYYSTMNANIHRGLHTLAEEATAAYEDVRKQVADFIGAGSHREVVFTRNTTESLNLLAYTLGSRLRPGDEIVLTTAEHHSNLVPWQLVTQRTGAVLRFIELNDDQQVDVDTARAAINANTRIVSIVHMSNVLGSVAPVAEISEMARSVGATMIVDAAQSAPHMPVDVSQLGADYLAFSAHKMLGPTGVGVLWGRQELLADLDPFLGGGEMISVVTREESSWAALPHKFEAGTPNIADVVAFGAALDFLNDVGMDAIAAHDADLTHYAVERLSRLEGLDIYGPSDPAERSAVIAFNYRDIHSHDVATILDRSGIAIRAGHHCAQPLMRTLEVPATARASFYLYNERSEVDALVDGLLEAGERFGFERGV
ncbi:MAG: cysteine desulfurase [Chloroflexi bacterium]|nr:cysteine desulfurase [Chloroflexota bacterium]MCY3587201.1 cysteine desulfurase [Chloroflexota bacterium]MCY3685908.1 cysteine desulfurase [Chloroflexota bacterium]MDE2709676.1 cysteine desulfurase [Chloroflexota bacterium]